MIVKAIYEPNFGDKTTGDTYETQIKRRPGDIFECDDELAKERIKGGFVKKATKQEIEEYEKELEELKKEKEIENKTTKTLEDCTIEELIQIATDENIKLEYVEGETTKETVIDIINTARTEQ